MIGILAYSSFFDCLFSSLVPLSVRQRIRLLQTLTPKPRVDNLFLARHAQKQEDLLPFQGSTYPLPLFSISQLSGSVFVTLTTH